MKGRVLCRCKVFLHPVKKYPKRDFKKEKGLIAFSQAVFFHAS
jgi:hypothetical protein